MPWAVRTLLDCMGLFQTHICSRVYPTLFFSLVGAYMAIPYPINLLTVTLHSDSANRHLKNQHWGIHSQASQLYLLSLLLTLCATSFLPMKLWFFIGTPTIYSPTNSITNHNSIKRFGLEFELGFLPKKLRISKYWPVVLLFESRWYVHIFPVYSDYWWLGWLSVFQVVLFYLNSNLIL